MYGNWIYSWIMIIAGFVISHGQDLEISVIPLPLSYTAATANGITQDQLGNIWMATTSQGLIKYSGHSFMFLRSEQNNPNALISDRLECVFADRHNFLWIGGFDNGLSRYDVFSETFANYIHDESDPNSIRSNAIRSIAEDSSGLIWIGTVQGLDYWDPTTEVFQRDFATSAAAELLSKEHVRVLYVDHSGILWAGTSSPFYGEQSRGGLFRIDPKEKSVIRYGSDDNANGLTNNIVTAIFEDSRGTFWVGTAEDGLHTMDRDKGEFQHHPHDPANPQKLSRPAYKNLIYTMDHIRFFQEDRHGRVWIGTINNGIGLYDPEQHSVIHLHQERTDQYQIPQDGLWASFKGRDDLLWITGWSPSSNEEVLFRVNLDPVEINYYELGTGTQTMIEDPNGDILMALQDYLIQVDENDELVQSFKLPGSEPSRSNDINRDANNNFWISTTRGLMRYDPKQKEIDLFPLYDNDLSVGDLLEVNWTDDLSPDSILVGSGNGLYLFDYQTKAFTRIPFDLRDKNARVPLVITDLHIDSRGNIWVGLANYGLQKLSRDLTSYQTYKFMENVQNYPLVIYEDQKGRLFVGTFRSGVRQYDHDRDSFDLITDKSGHLNPDTRVQDMISYGDSALLFRTSQGLFQYSLFSNKATAVDLEEINKYQITSSRMFLSSRDEFYVGADVGYLKFRAEKFRRNIKHLRAPSISKIMIDDVNLTSNILNAEEQYHLSYDQNNLSFTLNCVNFLRNPGLRDLEYILENHDRQWRRGAHDEEVYYYQLPPGSYTFRVKAEQQGTSLEDSLSFKIQPPWWRSWWSYATYVLLITFSIWRVHLYQKNRTIKKERERIRDRELAQAKEIEKAYKKLKTTQAQLIHAEKMASLGELTAGIAHEIQNPLNFVNNFSDVSTELLDEVKADLANGELDDASEIIDALKENLTKINHHGQRASSIVKGMLDHSRTSSAEKIPTDINQLCDEYVRLAYHGMRAKDKSFNVKYETHFDESIPAINIVPQDIGRVILNLVNNAFQATSTSSVQVDPSHATKEGKAKAKESPPREIYQPLVRIKTELAGSLSASDPSAVMDQTSSKGLLLPQRDDSPLGARDKSEDSRADSPSGVGGNVGDSRADYPSGVGGKPSIRITISDNGPGIPKEIHDKIFQPFFTTKPSGIGTGLGLSLSYDIVKAHLGELSVESEAGKGTTFTLCIPFGKL